MAAYRSVETASTNFYPFWKYRGLQLLQLPAAVYVAGIGPLFNFLKALAPKTADV